MPDAGDGAGPRLRGGGQQHAGGLGRVLHLRGVAALLHLHVHAAASRLTQLRRYIPQFCKQIRFLTCYIFNSFHKNQEQNLKKHLIFMKASRVKLISIRKYQISVEIL